MTLTTFELWDGKTGEMFRDWDDDLGFIDEAGYSIIVSKQGEEAIRGALNPGLHATIREQAAEIERLKGEAQKMHANLDAAGVPQFADDEQYRLGNRVAWLTAHTLNGRSSPYTHEEGGACRQCGRADGLDCVVPDDTWDAISKHYGGKNLLCAWCMDAAAAALGITSSASLHFAGVAIHGTSQSESDQQHIFRLATERDELRAQLQQAKEQVERLPFHIRAKDVDLSAVSMADLFEDIANGMMGKMSLCQAVHLAGMVNKAISRSDWPGCYVYHGMDNVLWLHNPAAEQDRPLTPSIAELLATNWELCEAPYHGPLDRAQHAPSRPAQPETEQSAPAPAAESGKRFDDVPDWRVHRDDEGDFVLWDQNGVIDTRESVADAARFLNRRTEIEAQLAQLKQQAEAGDRDRRAMEAIRRRHLRLRFTTNGWAARWDAPNGEYCERYSDDPADSALQLRTYLEDGE